MMETMVYLAQKKNVFSEDTKPLGFFSARIRAQTLASHFGN